MPANTNKVVFPTPLQRGIDGDLSQDFDALRKQIQLLAGYCGRLAILRHAERFAIVAVLIATLYQIASQYESLSYELKLANWLPPALGAVSLIILCFAYLKTSLALRLENRVLSKKLELIRERGPIYVYSKHISELKWAETKIELSRYDI